jgi:hypothetical protein
MNTTTQFSIDEYKLCYIDGSFAYFTTQPLSEQWGDDWNDAPYEHNAGTPYYFSDYDASKGRKAWDILEIGFRVGMDTPEQVANGNSRYSVESINRGDVAWLRAYGDGKPIYAGVNPLEFQALVMANGGDVFIPSTRAALFRNDSELDPLLLVYK